MARVRRPGCLRLNTAEDGVENCRTGIPDPERPNDVRSRFSAGTTRLAWSRPDGRRRKSVETVRKWANDRSSTTRRFTTVKLQGAMTPIARSGRAAADVSAADAGRAKSDLTDLLLLRNTGCSNQCHPRRRRVGIQLDLRPLAIIVDKVVESLDEQGW